MVKCRTTLVYCNIVFIKSKNNNAFIVNASINVEVGRVSY